MGTARNTTKQPDALDLLALQHDEVEELIEQLEDEDLAGDEKAAIFQTLGNSLAAHAEMEEKLFYPAVFAKQTEKILLESTEEHLAIKRVLADLMELELDDERFDAKLAVMKEEIHHHARVEEEGELFSKVRDMFDSEELIALGSEMLALYNSIMAGEPMQNVPAQTDRAAPVQTR